MNKTNEDIKSDSTFQPQVMENPETKVSKTDDEEINNTLELEVRPQTWEICNDFGKKIGYFKQIPLKIAYALTISFVSRFYIR